MFYCYLFYFDNNECSLRNSEKNNCTALSFLYLGRVLPAYLKRTYLNTMFKIRKLKEGCNSHKLLYSFVCREEFNIFLEPLYLCAFIGIFNCKGNVVTLMVATLCLGRALPAYLTRTYLNTKFKIR